MDITSGVTQPNVIENGYDMLHGVRGVRGGSQRAAMGDGMGDRSSRCHRRRCGIVGVAGVVILGRVSVLSVISGCFGSGGVGARLLLLIGAGSSADDRK